MQTIEMMHLNWEQRMSEGNIKNYIEYKAQSLKRSYPELLDAFYELVKFDFLKATYTHIYRNRKGTRNLHICDIASKFNPGHKIQITLKDEKVIATCDICGKFIKEFDIPKKPPSVIDIHDNYSALRPYWPLPVWSTVYIFLEDTNTIYDFEDRVFYKEWHHYDSELNTEIRNCIIFDIESGEKHKVSSYDYPANKYIKWLDSISPGRFIFKKFYPIRDKKQGKNNN